jgi:hypothetical protein
MRPTFTGTDFALAADSAGIDAALMSSETPLARWEIPRPKATSPVVASTPRKKDLGACA